MYTYNRCANMLDVHVYIYISFFFPIAEGGAIFLGVFRVKNHDAMPKNHDVAPKNPPGSAPVSYMRSKYKTNFT